MNDETMREAFEKWMIRDFPWIFLDATAGNNTAQDFKYLMRKAWDGAISTRAQASAPEGVESLINTCVGWVGAVACNGSLAYVAQDDIKREITKLFTRSNAKAGEVDGQVLPKGWGIEVRTANGKHALCVFGPDGCFAVHGDTDHKSDIRAEVIDQLRIALSTHDKTKA